MSVNEQSRQRDFLLNPMAALSGHYPPGNQMRRAQGLGNSAVNRHFMDQRSRVGFSDTDPLNIHTR